MTDATATAPAPDTTEVEEAPANCPACGSHVLFTVTLDHDVDGGYRLDLFGNQPNQGDTITRCDDCANFFVHDGAPTAATTTSSTTGAETEEEDVPKSEVQKLIDGALAAADAHIADLEARLKTATEQPPAPTAVEQPAAAVTPVEWKAGDADRRTGALTRRTNTSGVLPLGVTERRTSAGRRATDTPTT